jgi:hypothetical protein
MHPTTITLYWVKRDIVKWEPHSMNRSLNNKLLSSRYHMPTSVDEGGSFTAW